MMDYLSFKKKFFLLTGFNLESYKDQQMERRIKQFMERVQVKTFYDYYKLLEKSDQERVRFLDYLTINTTSFFRDPHVYRKLKSHVLPDILERKKSRIKIWSAGCSTGAEPYSLAILMMELVGNGSAAYRYSITATDIDPQALVKARLGQYAVNQLDHVSEKSRKKYFIPVGEQLQVRPEVKKRVTFKKHDLLKDSFEKGCDLILCRNVFIYFKPEIQSRLLDNFIDSLNPLGYMVIGCSENISNFKQLGLKKSGIAIFQKE